MKKGKVIEYKNIYKIKKYKKSKNNKIYSKKQNCIN